MDTKEKNKHEKTRLNINIDKKLKQEAKDTLEDLGLDLTTAVTMYLTQVIKKKKIPFEINATTYYSVDEVAGKGWRAEIQDVEDEWE